MGRGECKYFTSNLIERNIYYEIVHKVHNKKKMKKDQEKIKTQTKNTFETTLNYYIRLSEYS